MECYSYIFMIIILHEKTYDFCIWLYWHTKSLKVDHMVCPLSQEAVRGHILAVVMGCVRVYLEHLLR